MGSLVVCLLHANDIAEQFERNLNSPKQTWLLGAGVSYRSNIPLMHPLTDRVFEIAHEEFETDEEARDVIAHVRANITEGAHIEEFLTYLGDLISLAQRSRMNAVVLDGNQFSKDKLQSVHLTLLRIIASTVRWGYRPPQYNSEGVLSEEALVGARGRSRELKHRRTNEILT
jgi:hypothetical protein